MRPPRDARVVIDARDYRAEVAPEGYVSGVLAGSFLDKATGARDLGFGLAIADFLLEPADPAAPIPHGQYDFGNAHHGNIPKRYVEGPQICTQARRLPIRVDRGDGFTVVRQRYQWTQSYAPRDRAGSLWEQTLVFPDKGRYFFAADRVTTLSASPALFLRIDLPGHIRPDQGHGFDHVYLGYHDPSILPSTEFAADFPPDARFLYQRRDPLPSRFLRAYQVSLASGRSGPWLAGMTLDPADVHEAWCHSRGYVCLIQEIGGRPTQPGDTFGACYVLGWFDSIEVMAEVYDRHRGASGLAIDGPAARPTGFRLIARAELTPID